LLIWEHGRCSPSGMLNFAVVLCSLSYHLFRI